MLPFSVLFLIIFFLFLIKFFIADADFTLLKKKLKRDEIEDKVVWITGASRGIGEVLAKQFASLGAKLILSARNEAELERVKNQLSVLFILFKKSAALDVPEESFKAAFNVNVFGTISLTRLLAPYMLKRGRGHFVVMSSAAGKTPAPGQAIYCASKFALNGYFHCLRSELFQKGIKVTVVCPGPIETTTGAETGNSGQAKSTERRVSAERCAQLTIIAASHGLKEVWISYQPVLGVMYLVQYMPTIGFWLMDKIGGKRVEVAAQKGNTYSLGLLFGKSKRE